MDTFLVTAENISMLFVCMIAGFICHKKKFVSDEGIDSFSRALLNITLPAYIVFSFQRPFSKNLLMQVILIAFSTGFVFLFGALAARLICKLFKISDKDAGVYTTSLLLSNVVYMGAPVISAIYGPDAVFYTFVAMIPFQLYAFTFGVKAINMGYPNDVKFNILAILKTPAIVAVFIGVFMFLFGFSFPNAINGGLKMLGSITVPLSMIIIGFILAKSSLKDFVTNKTMYFFIFLKLVVLPLFLFFLLNPFIKDEAVVGSIALMAAMPVATVTVVLSSQYKTNETLASQMVCGSTIISLLTIPIVSAIIKAF